MEHDDSFNYYLADYSVGKLSVRLRERIASPLGKCLQVTLRGQPQQFVGLLCERRLVTVGRIKWSDSYLPEPRSVTLLLNIGSCERPLVVHRLKMGR